MVLLQVLQFILKVAFHRTLSSKANVFQVFQPDFTPYLIMHPLLQFGEQSFNLMNLQIDRQIGR